MVNIESLEKSRFRAHIGIDAKTLILLISKVMKLMMGN